MGVPSVAFREASGTTESVLDGQTGYLVDDLAGLVSATEQLLLDPVLRKELGEAAREFAEGFSWEATGAAVESLLSTLVPGAGPLAPDDADDVVAEMVRPRRTTEAADPVA
jgi:glycosyltransferase involved in cell wall biosynthesis